CPLPATLAWSSGGTTKSTSWPASASASANGSSGPRWPAPPVDETRTRTIERYRHRTRRAERDHPHVPNRPHISIRGWIDRPRSSKAVDEQHFASVTATLEPGPRRVPRGDKASTHAPRCCLLSNAHARDVHRQAPGYATNR